MNKDNQEFVNSLLQRLAKLNYIKPGDVPNIDLYMDQVTTFMDEHLSDVKRYEDDEILTKTMINNYTKNDLLPPPVKKKYSKEHIYVLTFIYYLKNILSISDIQKLLNPLTDKFFNKEELPDLILLDIKHIDDEEHKKLTGHTNKNILDCARYLSEQGIPMWIRHVLVPGGSDKDEYLHRLADFIHTLKTVERVEVLPYHTLGVFKWEQLGIPYPLEGVRPPSEERINNAREILGAI